MAAITARSTTAPIATEQAPANPTASPMRLSDVVAFLQLSIANPYTPTVNTTETAPTIR